MAKSSNSAATNSDDLSGQYISGPGAVSGVVHVIRDASEVQRFREGEILVAPETVPEWSVLFKLAKGIITERGDAPSHAATVALEYEIPAIIGVENAMQQLRSGDIITMHTDGTIERRTDRREPDSPMRVSVPAAVAARGETCSIITDPKVVALPEKPADDPVADDTDKQNAS